MMYILTIIYVTYGFNRGVSITEFSSKNACETALQEVHNFNKDRTFSQIRIANEPKCIEVKK